MQIKQLGKTHFVGGASDGTYGVVGYDFRAPSNSSLTAKYFFLTLFFFFFSYSSFYFLSLFLFPCPYTFVHRKAWFFFETEIVALATNVTCGGCHFTLTTSINQCLLKGDVYPESSQTISKFSQVSLFAFRFSIFPYFLAFAIPNISPFSLISSRFSKFFMFDVIIRYVSSAPNTPLSQGQHNFNDVWYDFK